MRTMLKVNGETYELADANQLQQGVARLRTVMGKTHGEVIPLEVVIEGQQTALLVDPRGVFTLATYTANEE